MLHFVLITAYLVISAAAAVHVGPLPKLVGRNGTRTLGIEEGIISCGSQGQLLEVRVSDCDQLPCSCLVGDSYTIEIDFIPSQAHPYLNVYLAVIIMGRDYPVINQDVPIPLDAGVPYFVQFPLLISEGFGTGLVAIRIRLSEGDVVELCGIGTADIHE